VGADGSGFDGLGVYEDSLHRLSVALNWGSDQAGLKISLSE